jgi:uncharacterized protein YjiS (DUF1127 family)
MINNVLSKCLHIHSVMNAEAPMTTTTYCNDGPVQIADRNPLGLMKRCMAQVAAWLRARETRRELAQLPYHLLCDIGLVRTGTGFTRIREPRPLYRAELFGDHLYRMTREKQL